MASRGSISRKQPVLAPDAEVLVVGLREPCPCGSGRRYKACHGREAAHRGEALVRRPFAGLPAEPDWVALREIVPAATARVAVRADPERIVTVATVLPLAWPALVRDDGSIMLGLQVHGVSGDPGRDLGFALEQALAAEPGTPVPPSGLPGDGPRLQDLIDVTQPFEVRMHERFDFWVEDGTELQPDVAASLERADAAVIPTVRLASAEAAYWCRIGAKEHLRWVLPAEEESTLDALARLHAAGEAGVAEGSRLVGTFRAHGLLVPVWDLVPGSGPDPVEESAPVWLARFEQALASTEPLSSAERTARAGLANRQLTLR